MARPIEIFFSYAREDEELMHDVRRQLVLFDRKEIIKKWHDRMIQPGSDWQGQIDARLRHSDIILLFVSPHFFDSDYIYEVEMAEALARHNAGECRVIPIITRPCLWQSSALGSIQALPRNATPITLWTNRDEACRDVADGIMRVVSELNR